MRFKLLLGGLIAGMGILAFADTTASASDTNRNSISVTTATSQSVVHSARLGEIDASTPIYRSYTNAQISADLNQIHLLSPERRREILIEVKRRIERDGRFVVEENEQRFGQVISPDQRSNDATDDEPMLEEIVVVLPEAEDVEDADALRAKEARKTRPPVRRVNSGRAYSPQ